MKISIIIPNYNGESLLKRNLPRVVSVLNDFAQKNKTQVQLVVTDDGSKDQSAKILNEYREKSVDGGVKFTIGFREKNGGFSSNVNFGVSLATGDIVVLLNTDVIPDKGFLEPLLGHFDDEDVFAVGCMDKSVEGGKIVLRGRGVGEWTNGFLQHKEGNLEKADTLWVSGGSGAFRRDVWGKLGGLSEIMNPFYWEDVDLSYRAWKAGYRMVFEKKSTVVHEHEEGVIKKTTTPERVKVTALRNQFIFVWINITDTGLLLNHIISLPIQLIKAFVRGDKVFLKGFIFALKRLPRAMGYRERNKKLFRVTDQKILKQFSD